MKDDERRRRAAESDYGHEQRTRALALTEDALRLRVDILLEQCGREAEHDRGSARRHPSGPYLHVSEIHMLLGVGRAPGYDALEALISGTSGAGQPIGPLPELSPEQVADAVREFDAAYPELAAWKEQARQRNCHIHDDGAGGVWEHPGRREDCTQPECIEEGTEGRS